MFFPFFIAYRLCVDIGFDIYSKYRFQIHQSSLYGIDFSALKRIGLLHPHQTEHTKAR